MLSWFRNLAAAALALCASAPVPAAEWTGGGGFGLRLEELSNPGLAVPPAPAWRRSLSFEGDLAARDADWDAKLAANYAMNQSDRPSLGQDAYGAALSATRRFERDTLGLEAALRRESTLTSEPGAGFAQSQRETRTLAPTWQRSLDERFTASVGATLQSATYAPRTRSLVDFTSAGLNAGLSYALTPRWQAKATLSATRFRTEPFSSDSDTAAASLGLQYSASESLSLGAGFGPSRTRSRVASLSRLCPVPSVFCEAGFVPFVVTPAEERRVSAGNTWNASLNWAPRERLSAGLAAARAVLPSGSGSLSTSETRSAFVTARLAERVTLAADIGQSRLASVLQSGASGAVTRTMAARLTWQFSERLQLEAGASLQQGRLASGARPEAQTLHAALRYTFARQALRRRRRRHG